MPPAHERSARWTITQARRPRSWLVPLASTCLVVAACGRAWFENGRPDAAGLTDTLVAPDVPGVPADAGTPETGPSWTPIGASADGLGLSAHGGTAACKAVVASPAGRLHAIWADDSTGIRQVYLKHWDGSTWGQLGGSGEADGLSRATNSANMTCAGDLAFDSQDRPYVVWMQSLPDAQAVYVKHWDGATWSELAGSATGYGLSGPHGAWWPTVDLDPLDRPVVSWSKSAEIYLLRYEAGAWVGIGGSDTYPTELAAHHGGNGQSVALRGATDIFLAYSSDWAGTDGIYFIHWDGGTWSGYGPSAAVGGLSLPGANSTFPELLLSADDQPLLLWQESSAAGDNLRIAGWDGLAWTPIGSDIGGPRAFNPSFCTGPDGTVVVAFDEELAAGAYQIRVRSWDGARFAELPDPRAGLPAMPDHGWPSIAAAPDRSLLLSWEEQVDATSRVVYCKRLAPE
jgi:hypothetical protein